MGKQKEGLSELWGSTESQQRTGSGAVLENDVHNWAQQFQNKEFLGNCEKQEKYIFTVLAENVSAACLYKTHHQCCLDFAMQLLEFK